MRKVKKINLHEGKNRSGVNGFQDYFSSRGQLKNKLAGLIGEGKREGGAR